MQNIRVQIVLNHVFGNFVRKRVTLDCALQQCETSMERNEMKRERKEIM